MKYYFNNKTYNLEKNTKYLKEQSSHSLNQVTKQLESEFNLDRLDAAWVSRATFGNVFVDFIPEKTGPTLLGAHKRLFELICDDVKYLIVSKKISRNFISKQIDDFEVLAINIDSYKTFIKSFGNQEQRIRLYLFRLYPEEEKIINSWMQAKHSTQDNNKIKSEEELLEFLSLMNIDSIAKFESFIQRINNVIKKKISSDLSNYQNTLDEFKALIDNESIKETKLSKFLHEHPWILDFRYLGQRLDKIEREYKTSVGNVDIFISKEQFGIKNDIIIELKRTKNKTTKAYRNKPAITAEVGNGLSQMINYMETQKEHNRVQEGLLIVGRKKDPFFAIFNQHLSKIRVITYEDIAENCQIVIDAFKSETTQH